jgi:hypothetical protein
MSLVPSRPRRHKHHRIARLEGGHWGVAQRKRVKWDWRWTRRNITAVIVLLAIAGLFVTDQALKTPGQPSPGILGVHDPDTTIWSATDPGNNGAEFNLRGFNDAANCKVTTSCLQSSNTATPTYSGQVGYQQCGSCSGSITSSAISISTNDFLIVSLTSLSSNYCSVAAPTDTASNTWTKQTCQDNSGTGSVQIWTAKAAASSASDTVTFATGVTGDAQIVFTSVENEVSIGVIASENNGGATTTGLTSTTMITPTIASWAVFESLMVDTQVVTSLTYGSSQTELHRTPSTAGGTTDQKTGTVTTSQNFNITFAASASVHYRHVTMIFYGIAASPSIAVAITKAQVGDLSVVSGKALSLNFTWSVNNPSPNVDLGMFLTTNSTLPVQSNWNPYNDTNVAYLLRLRCVLNCTNGNNLQTWSTNVFSLRTLGQSHSIATEDNSGNGFAGTNACGALPSAGSCFLSSSFIMNTNPSSNFVRTRALLNYTGNTIGNTNCATSGTGIALTVIGSGCSMFTMWNGTLSGTTFNTRLPWFQFQSQQYYLGTYMLATGTSMQLDVAFQQGSLGTFAVSTYNVGTAVAVAPNLDTTGFFGPIIKALIVIAIFMLQELLIAVSFIAPAIKTALVFLETIIQTVGDAIGNGLGFGNVGTSLIQVLNGIITFFISANGFSAAISNLPSLISRFIDFLGIYMPWLPISLSIALNVVTLGVNGILFGVKLIGVTFTLVSGVFVTLLIGFWFIYTGDDALGGVLAFLEFFQWLIFGIGIGFLERMVNFGLDFLTMVLELIPKPVIQSSAKKIPRLPILQTEARFVAPSFDLGEIRTGNMFAILMWIIGFDFFARYESASPALPGSITNLIPAASGFQGSITGLIPILDLVTLLTGGLALVVWPTMRMFTLIGLDLGVEVPIGPGRRISGGGFGLKVVKAEKHFQRKTRAEKEALKPLSMKTPEEEATA